MQVVRRSCRARPGESRVTVLFGNRYGRRRLERADRPTRTAGEDQRGRPEDRKQFGVGGADAANRPDLGGQRAVEDGEQPGEASLDLFHVDDVRVGQPVLGQAGRGVVDLRPRSPGRPPPAPPVSGSTGGGAGGGGGSGVGVGVGVGAGGGVGVREIEVGDGATDELVVNALRPVPLSDEHPASNNNGTVSTPKARVSRFTGPPEHAQRPRHWDRSGSITLGPAIDRRRQTRRDQSCCS